MQAFFLTSGQSRSSPFWYSVHSLTSSRAARAYRRASQRLRAGDIGARLAYLLYHSRIVCADALTTALDKLSTDLRCTWLPLWANWSNTVESEVIAELPGGISAFTFYEDEGAPFVILSALDRVIVCDGITGRELARSPPLGLAIRQVACIESEDQAYIVAVGELEKGWGEPSCVALVSLRHPECLPIASVPNAHTHGWGAFRAFGTVNTSLSQYVATSGGEAAMRLWSIPNLKLVAENKKVYAACIYRVFSMNVTGEPILICGSDSVTDGGVYLAKGPLLCAMKLPSLGVTRRVFAAGSGLVKFAVPLDVPGRTLVVVTYTYAGADGGVKVVDMDQRRVLGSSELMAEVFGTIQHSGSEFLVFGAYYGELHTLRIQIKGNSRSGNTEIELLPTRHSRLKEAIGSAQCVFVTVTCFFAETAILCVRGTLRICWPREVLKRLTS